MRYDSGRYTLDDDFTIARRELSAEEVESVQRLLIQNINPEISYPQITADQNDYPLDPGILQRLSSDASRTITGFANPDSGLKWLVNVGSNNIVIANDNAGSLAANRVLCHTGANITLNPNESVQIGYDFTSSRWRTVGFV